MMKRTISWLRPGLASVALIPLVAACSTRPAEAPTGAQIEPGTQAGQVPEAQAQQAPGAMGAQPGQENVPGAMGQQPGQAGQPFAQAGQQPGQQYGQPGQPPGQMGQQPGQVGQQGFGAGLGEQGEAATMSEKAACDALAQSSRLRVEDTKNGVTIVATPKAGQSLATTRDDAKRFDQMVHGAAAARTGEACGLADLVRQPNVTSHVTEGANDVRITLSTPNANEAKALRRIARDEVNSLTKGAGKQQPQMQHQPQR
jgi:hypothetical protein